MRTRASLGARMFGLGMLSTVILYGMPDQRTARIVALRAMLRFGKSLARPRCRSLLRVWSDKSCAQGEYLYLVLGWPALVIGAQHDRYRSLLLRSTHAA